jgi:TonB family protein
MGCAVAPVPDSLVSSARRYRHGRLLTLALALTATLHVALLAGYELSRSPPPPVLRVTLESRSPDRDDLVLISRLDGTLLQRCHAGDPRCRVEVRRGEWVRIDAISGKTSTLEAWDGCEVGHDVTRCHRIVMESAGVRIRFGRQPEEIDVAMLPSLDDPEATDEQLALTPPRPEPDPIDAEKLEEPPIELALVAPPPPELIPPPPPPEPPPAPQPPEAKQELPPVPNLRMVEVPDDNEVADEPDDATHLSDKNRDVAEETRATETNLEKEMKGEEIASAPSPDTSDEIGGPEHEIHQLETSEATTADRAAPSDHSGAHEVARGAVVGEAGREGEEGKGEREEPGMLSMRGIEGRGSVVDRGGDGKREGKKGSEGLKTQLEFDDYERIVGKDKAEKERAIAKREQSMKKGRYQKRLQAVKSALENFTPDIKPGNQTALKTRAHPFALYVARMHRRIHELWGFGFLEDLDGKPSQHPMNNFDLFTSIEVAINPDGSVHKMTIAKGSGILEFDVAALHTIDAAGPYGQTPEKIRSVDGRVYLRWGFYRNWRQCGTFNVEPYILTDIANAEPLAEGMDLSDGVVSAADAEGDREHAPARGSKPMTPEPPRGSGAAGSHDDHGHAAGGDSTQVKYASNMWVAGFSSASIDRMLKVSAVPFYAGTEVAAQTVKDLRSVYENLLVESGALKRWEVVTAEAYRQKYGTPLHMTAGALVIDVVAQERFGIVLVPTKSGEYRAQAIVR